MNFPEGGLDVLVIAAHPDDAELGMAGGILQLKQEGQAVGILDLTDGEPTPHGSVELRSQETAAASEILGIDWRGNLGLPNRSLEASLEARGQLAEVIRQTRPRWLFAPYGVDAHPDHVAATELVQAARFWAKLTKSNLAGEPHHPERIYDYYSVHLKHAAQPAYVLDISQHWEQKQAALACYQSQFVTGRSNQAVSFLEQLQTQAAYWGQLIGCQYGEPYASCEPLGLSGFSQFI
jgi:bacillithiol biosynthesis deacetylase BshB1